MGDYYTCKYAHHSALTYCNNPLVCGYGPLAAEVKVKDCRKCKYYKE